MIGTREDAWLALTDPTAFLLDEGTTRKVYLINGVVYKVDLPGECANELEICNYYRYRNSLPQGVFLPEMQLYRINGRYVVAAEYIDGIPTGDCIDEACGFPCTCEEECLNADLLGLIPWFTDTAWGNAVWYDGVLYLLDICY